MAQALAQFRERRDLGTLTVAWLDAVAVEAAGSFMRCHHDGGAFLSDAISLLCEAATLDRPELARPGVRGLFGFLVERLSDAFDPRYCELYDRLFAQVVTFCRGLPAGHELDAALARFGLRTEADLLARKGQLSALDAWPERGRDAVRKVLVLSRVTLGADVAVTSVCMAGAKLAFPGAEVVLVGLPVVGGLFVADGRVRVHGVRYDRGGDLLGRLNAWLGVLDAVQAELDGLAPGEYVVIDPDSRLTQLGIFPVLADDRRYLFFESRGYRTAGAERISELAGHWLATRLGLDGPLMPYVAPSEDDLEAGRRMRRRLRRDSQAVLVVVNLGVGGNERKRLGQAFETALLRALVAEGCTVVLAKGVGAEVERAQRLARKLGEQGLAVADWRGGVDDSAANLLTWEGPVGAYCGLIAASDLYVGYDSAGQHLAGALGVPTVDIFVDDRHPMIAKRWRPFGPGPVAMVQVADCDDVLSAAMAQVRALLATISGPDGRAGPEGG